jgi:hypothetical protein
MEKIFARVIQVLFHPLLISVMGVFILFRTNLYVAFISGQMRQLVLFSTFATTCLVPLIFIFSLRLINKHLYAKGSSSEVSIIYLFTAISYYSEYYFISKMPLTGFYKTGFLAGTLLLISLSLISLRWNISSTMAGVGAMAGISVAVMLRLGIYNPYFLSAVLMTGGLSGFSRLALDKNTPGQVCAGYLLGFGILYSVFTLI